MKNELNDILHRFNKERNRKICRHYQEMRERVVAQSNVINELNDQLSRYYNFDQWQMEMVEKRCNPPLKLKELHEGMWVWLDEHKRYYKIKELFTMHKNNYVRLYDDRGDDFFTKYDHTKFYEREVKE